MKNNMQEYLIGQVERLIAQYTDTYESLKMEAQVEGKYPDDSVKHYQQKVTNYGVVCNFYGRVIALNNVLHILNNSNFDN